MIQVQPSSQARWKQWLQNLILLGMGVYLLVLLISGDLNNYINTRFAWLTVVAAIGFFVLGGWQTWQALQSRQHNTHSPGHLPITWGGMLIVAVPLLLAVLVPSQPLTSDAITGSISLDPVGGVSAEARFDLPPLERNVLDWLREFNRVASPAELNGVQVDIVAFVYREPGMSADQFMAARFTLSCCVADAFAVGMPVSFLDAAHLPDGTWVRIQGTLQAGMFRGELMPVIQPTQVEEIDTPDQPYLYS